jgi:hypothetical protein
MKGQKKLALKKLTLRDLEHVDLEQMVAGITGTCVKTCPPDTCVTCVTCKAQTC